MSDLNSRQRLINGHSDVFLRKTFGGGRENGDVSDADFQSSLETLAIGNQAPTRARFPI